MQSEQSAQQVSLVANMESRLDVLARQQQETLELLRQLASSSLVHSRPPPAIENGVNLLPAPPTKRPRTDGQANPDDFESAFSTMLQAYSAMSNEMKAEKVRRLVRSLPTRDGETLEVRRSLFNDTISFITPTQFYETYPALTLVSYLPHRSCLTFWPHKGYEYKQEPLLHIITGIPTAAEVGAPTVKSSNEWKIFSTKSSIERTSPSFYELNFSSYHISK